ncbi:hypothetical protein JMJ77_0009438 [Colletotrichum scovillei]|uniref:Uncharacterized protein n=1 Tax=Colletotrichum scovillei TaxID=1209932 RepID=A0A9P7U9C6_9PEZI|nr:hypothetical protein JMJ77_0009438 [Colletotrichum scovillei]KAG7052518.1 hypothetical protein JMJ78_0005534 [Colletotrichum scovillei]KAG7064808.1 hypothetical protein JMJ76_0012566 [Colletotrichum scovillei]
MSLCEKPTPRLRPKRDYGTISIGQELPKYQSRAGPTNPPGRQQSILFIKARKTFDIQVDRPRDSRGANLDVRATLRSTFHLS